MRISPVGHGYAMVVLFSIPFGSIYHARTYIPTQNRPGIKMVDNGTDQNNNSNIQIFSHLEKPTLGLQF